MKNKEKKNPKWTDHHWENASEYQRLHSVFMGKVNWLDKKWKDILIKSKLRKEQTIRDHNFIEILKTEHPEVYKKVVETYKIRYPKERKLRDLRREYETR